MYYIPLEEILGKAGGSLYKLVVAASIRALELSEGAEVLVEQARDVEKPTVKALLEIKAGKIQYVPKKKRAS